NTRTTRKEKEKLPLSFSCRSCVSWCLSLTSRLRPHLLGGRDALARLDRVAHLLQHQLHAGQGRQHVELVDIAHVRQADDPPLQGGPARPPASGRTASPASTAAPSRRGPPAPSPPSGRPPAGPRRSPGPSPGSRPAPPPRCAPAASRRSRSPRPGSF